MKCKLRKIFFYIKINNQNVNFILNVVQLRFKEIF